MASLDPKFILEKPNLDIDTYIMVAIRYNYKRIKISTGDKIKPLLWDKEDQRPTTDKKILRNLKPIQLKELKYISLHLDEIEYFIKDLVLDLKKDKTISLDIIKDKLVEFLGRKKEGEPEEEESIKLIEYYENLIERMEQGSFITDKGSLYTPGTIKSHRVCKNQIVGFEEEWGSISFDSIDIEFYIALISYFHTKDYKQNEL